MNFIMFSNVMVHKVGEQFIVSARRVFLTRRSRVCIYKPETFLITRDEARAWNKHNLLVNCTCKL